MENRMLKIEGFLRTVSVILALLTASVVGLNTETKTIFIEMKATVKDLAALWVLTIAASVTGGYQLLQLVKCLVFVLGEKEVGRSSEVLSWVCLVLDQVTMYGMVCITAAATQASLVAIFGVEALEWRKVCKMYTRFCVQVGGGLVCAYAAFLTASLLAFISTYRIFRKRSLVKRVTSMS